MPAHLVDRDPQVTPQQMAAALVPPPQFADASFASYRPDPEYPSQADVRDAVERFVATRPEPAKRGLFGRRREPVQPARSGVYLDGGFGVGKTHLLAAAYHAEPSRKTFGTFIEYTAWSARSGSRAPSTCSAGRRSSASTSSSSTTRATRW